MSDESVVRELLGREKLAQFASNTAHGPRVFSAWYAYDPTTSSIIFTSNKNRNHSHEWELDARAGGTILGVTPEGLGQKVEAVSFFGTISVATSDRLRQVYDIYASKWPQVRGMIPVDAVDAGISDMRFYELIVTEWVLFSEINRPDGPRVSVPPFFEE